MELDEATRKRTRVTTSSSAVDPDRLSALPLLHAIMSFMKARQAVQTCVLSSRWRHLWRSIPCLNIDLDEFKEVPAARAAPFDIDEEEDYGITSEKEWECFEDFTVNLMLHCNILMLDSFRLRLGRGTVPYSFERQASGWIRRAIKYRTPNPPIHREGMSSSSWRLRRLHLHRLFLHDDFMKHVSSVCCSLEDLELEYCTCEIHSITSHSLNTLVLKCCSMRKLYEIASPTLKTLVIDGCSNREGLLVISAPAVACLFLRVHVGYFDGGISINKMSSLAKASIYLLGCRKSELESELGGNQSKLLRGVSNVTSLDVSGFRTMVLGKKSTTTFQEFKGLKNLLLDNCDLSDDFHTLVLFLQNAPNLEKLTLRHCQFSVDSKKKPKKTSSSEYCSLDLRCEKLNLTEIIYKDDDVRHLVDLLLRISGKLPNNYIKLTKAD